MYALGGVLFALLTARPPFQGEDLMAAMAQHVHAPPPRPSAVRPDVPPEVDGLVVALLAKDPAQRPTATDVVAGLDGSPSAAVAPTIAMPAVAAATTQMVEPPRRQPRRRSRTGVLAAAVVLALALIAAVVVIANAGNDTTGTSANPPATPRTPTSPSTSTSTSKTKSQSASPSRTPSTSHSRPAPTTLSGALAALRTAVTGAAASGGLDAKDAQDLLHRVDDLTAATSGSGPGHGPDHGNGDGKGHGDKHGGTPDLSGMLDDFAHHLDDLQSNGQISSSAYSSISTALDTVRSFSGSGSD